MPLQHFAVKFLSIPFRVLQFLVLRLYSFTHWFQNGIYGEVPLKKKKKKKIAKFAAFPLTLSDFLCQIG